eukprot:jgi/Mesvir1/13724/Mv05697-RA.1
MSQVIRYLTPADGAEEDPHFSGKIRVTDNGMMSILDTMSALGLTNPTMYWKRLREANPELKASIGAAGSSRDLNTRRQSLAMAFMQLTEAEMIKETGLDPIQVAKRTRELMEPGFRATGLHDQQPEKKYILENRGAMRLNQKLTREGQLPSHPQAAALPSVV